MEDIPDILKVLIEIKGDVGTIKSDSAHIRETTTALAQRADVHSQRIRLLENWKAKATGVGLGLVVVVPAIWHLILKKLLQ